MESLRYFEDHAEKLVMDKLKKDEDLKEANLKIN